MARKSTSLTKAITLQTRAQQQTTVHPRQFIILSKILITFMGALCREAVVVLISINPQMRESLPLTQDLPSTAVLGMIPIG
ncbi:hypothetical protein FGO68_gene17527 [Halteria grandinella]|uniref:Uncharacterized protein n=1 Tax=Halteria grandinella TaxID=5974 RepID=A0A8J8P8P4_HALGN|nr:hypothetical protein FGO68_gene17527 [Halteria grandinella]